MPPLVSVITPTKDRRPFIPQLLRVFDSQDWPHLELVILDDGRDPVGDLVSGHPRVRYETLSPRAPIGTKRNLLCELAKGEFIVHIDDDDFHPADRVSRAVARLEESGADVVGSSRYAFYDIESGGIHVTPTIGKKHAAAGTMAYRRSYWEAHRWAPDPHTEERQFLQNFVAKLAQLEAEPWEIMLAISHGENTLPKNTSMPKAPVTLEQIIADPVMRDFYDTLETDDW